MNASSSSLNAALARRYAPSWSNVVKRIREMGRATDRSVMRPIEGELRGKFSARGD